MRYLALLALVLPACGNASIAISPVPAEDSGSTVSETGPDAIDGVDVAPSEDTTPTREYPEGPYGLATGNVFPNLVLQGYRDGTGEWVEMSMLDYYDPEGTRGITAIHLDAETQWCAPSNSLGDQMPAWWTTGYQARGARLITTLLESLDPKKDDGGRLVGYLPATQSTLDQWIKRHHTNFDIMLDAAELSLPHTGSVGLPYRYLIDPRTMRIALITQGIDPGVRACKTDDDCCKATDTPDGCTVDYLCSPTWKTCLAPTMTGPIVDMERLMVKNGAAAFPTGLTP